MYMHGGRGLSPTPGLGPVGYEPPQAGGVRSSQRKKGIWTRGIGSAHPLQEDLYAFGSQKWVGNFQS